MSYILRYARHTYPFTHTEHTTLYTPLYIYYIVIYERLRDTSKITTRYLHHHFPASDIPPQARDLYLKNGTRCVYLHACIYTYILSCICIVVFVNFML